MEFNTDRQRRDALYDCVKLLAKAKSLPIFAQATGKGVGDQCYHVTMGDKEVTAFMLSHQHSNKLSGQEQFVVKVPFDIFDVNSTDYKAVDAKFRDDEKVSMIYGRIGQLIYSKWRDWRRFIWPEVS